MTNKHLLEGVSETFIQTADGKRFRVIENNTDASTDLAVLRFDAPSSLPVARLGDSDRLQIGDWVLTIGSPLDLKQTVARDHQRHGTQGGCRRGRWSAANGRRDKSGKFRRCIVNLRGEVSESRRALRVKTAGKEIGFAIPANVALQMIAELPKEGP